MPSRPGPSSSMDPEDYHANIDNPELGIDENTILFIRGVGPLGYPGAAEVVNMRAPSYLLKEERAFASLRQRNSRQSGTSGSPSILNASPEAAAGGGLAILKNGDRVRIDLNQGACNVLISAAQRSASAGLNWKRPAATPCPKARRPGRKIFRATTAQLAEGMVIKGATKFQRIARVKGIPRDNH